MKKIIFIFFLFAHIALGEITMAMTLTSNAFSQNGAIPSQYTCDAAEISPQLSWHNIPSNAKSLALIVEDPDAPDPRAPKITWVHWVLYNIPVNATELPENATQLPGGTLIGTNSRHQVGYQGPCPPIGTHRYFFKLYALNDVLPDLHQPTADKLRAAMKGKVIEETALIGTYSKK